jgi:hypothetical protein
MPIQIACPQCDWEYNLADSLQGKRVRCKNCDATFVVEDKGAGKKREPDQEKIVNADENRRPRARQGYPENAKRRDRYDDEDERPARRREDWDEEDREPRFRKKRKEEPSNTGLIIGLIAGGAGLLAVGAVVAIIFLLRSNDAPDPSQANVNNENRIPKQDFPGQPANANWNNLKIGMTEQQVVNLFGPPAQSMDLEGIHVIHANVTEAEVKGPNGKTRPVKKLVYFKGFGEVGFMNITLVDGKVYKITK